MEHHDLDIDLDLSRLTDDLDLDLGVDVTVDLDLPVDDAWPLVADGEELARWLGPTHGLGAQLAPGDAGTIVDDDGSALGVEVVEVSPPDASGAGRIVWRWGTGDRGDDRALSTVVIEVRPHGSGTRVRVTETVALVGPVARAAAAGRSVPWSARLLRLELVALGVRGLLALR